MAYPIRVANGINRADATDAQFFLFAGEAQHPTNRYVIDGPASIFTFLSWNTAGDKLIPWVPAISAAIAATGTITFVDQPVADDTVTVAGTTITFKDSGATGAQVNIGANAAATAQALKAYITTNTSALTVAATGAANVLTIAANTAGAAGNAKTLATTSAAIELSGLTLTGGFDTATGTGAIAALLACEAPDAPESLPVYEAGVFNEDAINWPPLYAAGSASATTAARKSAVSRSNSLFSVDRLP